MAIAFAYTEATNTVVVTGGTSGTPATFADFVTADRAGTAELKAATNCAKDMTLTYQIRPVEDRALKISFIIASKTAHTDYLYITGTDAWDTALYECIDISAGDGTYVSTQYFRTITDIDVEDAGDGSGTAAADGTLQVTQPCWGVIWDYGNGQYQVDAIFDIGNGSTSTYFQSLGELVTFNDDCPFSVTNSATCKIGTLDGDWPVKGSTWSNRNTDISAWINLTTSTGTLLLYGSSLYLNGSYYRSQGNMTVRKSVVSDISAGNWGQFSMGYVGGVGTIDIKDFFITNNHRTYYAPNTITNSENIHIHSGNASGVATWWSAATADKILITSSASNDFESAQGNLTLTDPIVGPVSPIILRAGDWIKEQYTCNITVADKDGTLLDGVEVLCEDQADAQVFTTTTGDTDTGKIDEQTITYKTWTGTSETLVTSSPHKFTLSKAGYETLVLDNITVDGPIDWHFELLTQNKIFGATDIVKVCGVG